MIVDEILIVAGIDIQRSIEPPMSGIEQKTRLRPDDDVLLERFLEHARRSVRLVKEPTILVFPWRSRTDHDLRRTLTALSEKLPAVETGNASKQILFIQDHESAFDFEAYARRDGTILGKVHQGGIWMTNWGRFFLITWHPTVPRTDIGKRLAGFLSSDDVLQTQDEEQSAILSGPLLRNPPRPSRRPSSTAIRAVAPPDASPVSTRRSSERPSKRRP